jgi:hyperosmotically inducible protein
MRAKGILPSVLAASVLLAFAIGCNTNKAATPDVKDQVAHSLGNAGFKDVKVSTDNNKQLVTLQGDVKTQEDKERAEDVAKGAASGWVVSNEIGVRPDGVESAARKIDSNVDSAIEKDFKAVLIANHLDNQHIRYEAKNGVLTLKGDVDNAAQRENAEKLAATVPNVAQVVNELDVKGAKGRHTPSGE